MIYMFLPQILVPLLTYVLSQGLMDVQRIFLTIFVWVVFNWLFSKTPLHIIGLLGTSLAVLFGVEKPSEAFAPYADPIIMLFLAGFLFAKGMQNTGLDKRISLNLLTMKWIKGRFEYVLLIIMGTTAFFSMWVSNTATAAMMLPLVLGILSNIEHEKKETILSLTLISLAYASSIGGIGTPIGSPPNVIAISFLEKLANIKVTFFGWMLVAIPIMISALALTYFYILKALNGEKILLNTDSLLQEKSKLPKMALKEKYFAFLFIVLIIFWFQPFYQIEAGTIGILMACLLFMSPLENKLKILKPDDISKIDWSSLLLFGSGISLGKMLFKTDLASLMGNSFLSAFEASPAIVLLTIVSLFTIFFTEVASNTATANIIIPIVIAFALRNHFPSESLTIAVAIACSFAFMLPVATPPNAIVYGTGLVKKGDMAKFGFFLNIAMAFLLPIILWIYYH